MKIKKRSQFPKCIQKFKEVKGISVHDCIGGHDMADHSAHAHCFPGDPYRGWICAKYAYNLKERLTMLHEVAHLIANTSESIPFHGKIWKKAVERIGGTYKAYSYRHGNKRIGYPDYTYRNTKR